MVSELYWLGWQPTSRASKGKRKLFSISYSERQSVSD